MRCWHLITPVLIAIIIATPATVVIAIILAIIILAIVILAIVVPVIPF